MHLSSMSDGLTELARASDQRRDAAILRATTELFVQESAHNADEVHRYEVLATHFLPKVNESERALVAHRLADCTNAPLAVLLSLAGDCIAVAEPVLLRSRALTPIALLSIIASTGSDHHRAIARREHLPPEVMQALQSTGSLSDSAPQSSERVQATLLRRAEEFADIASGRRDAWRFLALDGKTRNAVISDAQRLPMNTVETADTRIDRAFRSILSAAQIVGYARSGQVASVVAAMADGLQLPTDLVAAAINDGGGEMLAVILKAMRLDDTQARQIFLLTSPAGRDVHTFFPLAELYSGMDVSVAESLVASWRSAFVRKTSRERHEIDGASVTERRRDTIEVLPHTARRA